MSKKNLLVLFMMIVMLLPSAKTESRFLDDNPNFICVRIDNNNDDVNAIAYYLDLSSAVRNYRRVFVNLCKVALDGTIKDSLVCTFYDDGRGKVSEIRTDKDFDDKDYLCASSSSVDGNINAYPSCWIGQNIKDAYEKIKDTPDKPYHPEPMIGGIKYGDTRETVIKKMGQPIKEELFEVIINPDNGRIFTEQSDKSNLYYEGIMISIYKGRYIQGRKISIYKENSVTHIYTFSPKYATAEGIRVGDSKQKVLELCGIPIEEYDGLMTYISDKGTILFHIDDGVVIGITVGH